MMYGITLGPEQGELTMTPENSQPPTSCETPASRTGQGCPACGAALIPLRGQWRCSRCYFMLCVGCEPAVGHEPAGESEG
jgi:hypothetical protein